VGRLDAEKYQFLDDPQPVLDGLRKSGTRVDLFTFMQRLPESEPKFRYPMEWDNFAALPISTFDHWRTQQIGFKARNKAKQAEKKGVTLREVPFDDALVKGIWEIYNECPVRQGRPFTHYGKDIETVRKEEATYLDSSIFIGAFLGDSMIGFVKMVSDETRTQAGLMNIVSMIKHRDKAPTNALVAQAVRSCAERQISYLVYANFAYGKKQPDSVADFKERNAFQQMNVPRYYVPLTPIGWAALRLGLHHRFIDHFPEPWIAKLREFRNAWYNRKFQSVAEPT
ncbi:MAG TPA: hypothetical protein VK210_07610, partial [Terriglobia bacterium]|nr:hypothetical protein [Terriglobia bacterium]